MQKNTTGLQAEQIFSVTICNIYIFNFGYGFCDSFSMLFPEAPASCGKTLWNNFCSILLLLSVMRNCTDNAIGDVLLIAENVWYF